MAPLQGILIDTSPYSASPQLTKLRYEREKIIIAAWQKAMEDKAAYSSALGVVDRFHLGNRNVRLVDWQKGWLRAKYPSYEEYHAFEPAPFFEDVLKKYWAAEERKRIETLEREHPLLLPTKAWTDPAPSQIKDEGKQEEKTKEEDAKAVAYADENLSVRERLRRKHFLNYEDFINCCYARKEKQPDLMSF